MSPSSAPRQAPPTGERVLIVLTGLTPAVLSETLYVLAVDPPAGQAAWVPDRIVAVTTGFGREMILRPPVTANEYVLPMADVLQAMQRHCDALELGIVLPGTVEVDSIAADDVGAVQDLHALADQLGAVFRRHAQSPTSQIHLSVAGGRKGMGWMAAQVMALYGRQQDRASQVLVDWPYESDPSFYFPGQDGYPTDRASSELVMTHKGLHLQVKSVRGEKYPYLNANVTLVDLGAIKFHRMLSVPMRQALEDHAEVGVATLARWLDEYLSARAMAVDTRTSTITLQSDHGTVLATFWAPSVEATLTQSIAPQPDSIAISRRAWALWVWLAYLTTGHYVYGGRKADVDSKFQATRAYDAIFCSRTSDIGSASERFDDLLRRAKAALDGSVGGRTIAGAEAIREALGHFSTAQLASTAAKTIHATRLKKFMPDARRSLAEKSCGNPLLLNAFAVNDGKVSDWRYTHLTRFFVDGAELKAFETEPDDEQES